MANLGGEELEAVASSPKLNPNTIGVPQPYLNKLNYRRTDHDDPRIKKTAFSINMAKPRSNAAEEANGPVIHLTNLKSVRKLHSVQLTSVSQELKEIGMITTQWPFNEDDPMSWTEDYLSWWPKPMEYRSCYIKVNSTALMSSTFVLAIWEVPIQKTVGPLYGIRDTRSIRDMDQSTVSAVCLEFKCSGCCTIKTEWIGPLWK